MLSEGSRFTHKITRPSKYLIGYYGSWAAYNGYTPNKINASKINVIDYAFAKIGSDLKIAAGDTAVDYTNFAKLKTLKSKYPELKTVISVGGWEDSGRFSDAALTEASRAAFADSAVKFIRTYGFDGVDIDWEYPAGGGLSTNVSRSADKQNFGLLLKALRTKLDAQGTKDGRHYILSFAGEASASFSRDVELYKLAKTVDYGFIMTYDMHTLRSPYTDFNAPLYTPCGSSPQYKTSVNSAVCGWISSGFPADKIIMGVPFYGYAYKDNTDANGGLWQRYSAHTTLGYDTIASKYLTNSAYKKSYSASAMEPSLFNGSTFISYDDASSIGLKARYAVSKNLLGVGAWDLSYDRNGTLVNAIRNALN